MVRIAEFSGINLSTVRLSYNSTAIEFISVRMLSKPCQMSSGMETCHFLLNPVVHGPNPDPNLLSPLNILVALPNQF